MTDREKLLDLLQQGREMANELCGKQDGCEKCPYQAPKGCAFGIIADHLITNGVTISSCKVGDTVYALYSRAEYKTRYGSRRRQNTQIHTLHHREWAKRENAVEIREKQCTKSDVNLLGKTVFLTREEAEKAIKRCQK